MPITPINTKRSFTTPQRKQLLVKMHNDAGEKFEEILIANFYFAGNADIPERVRATFVKIQTKFWGENVKNTPSRRKGVLDTIVKMSPTIFAYFTHFLTSWYEFEIGEKFNVRNATVNVWYNSAGRWKTFVNEYVGLATEPGSVKAPKKAKSPKAPKVCPPGKIINPATGRCITLKPAKPCPPGCVAVAK